MMIQERIAGLRKYMAQYGLEQVLMGNPININYFTKMGARRPARPPYL